MPSRTFASDEQIKAEGGKGAFLIIADNGVRAVFILLVKLVPCGKAGFGKGLFQTAFGLLYAGNALRKQVQIGFGRNATASGEEQVVVVGCNPFESPKLLSVVFAVEMVGDECFGLDGFNVPCVEVFVGNKPSSCV